MVRRIWHPWKKLWRRLWRRNVQWSPGRIVSVLSPILHSNRADSIAIVQRLKRSKRITIEKTVFNRSNKLAIVCKCKNWRHYDSLVVWWHFSVFFLGDEAKLRKFHLLLHRKGQEKRKNQDPHTPSESMCHQSANWENWKASNPSTSTPHQWDCWSRLAKLQNFQRQDVCSDSQKQSKFYRFIQKFWHFNW